MADCCTSDINTSFIDPNAAPYAAPGNLYQYDLYWIVDQLRKMLCNEEVLRKHDLEQDKHLDGLDECTAHLKTAFDALAEKLAKGDFAKGDFENWAIENMPGIIQTMCKFVFFGLTDDGHFVAYVPQSWEFLHFDTILTPGNPKYGHLIMYY